MSMTGGDFLCTKAAFSRISCKRSKGMGQAGISFDHRGSSAAGDVPELTRLRAGPQHTIRKEVWLMLRLLVLLIKLLRDANTITITIKK